jgi:hypothetical protein
MRLALLSLIALLSLTAAASADVVFPDDSGYQNVKTVFGARGDGQTDDTAALNEALNAGNGALYFPNGVYLVSDTIGGKQSKRRFLQGQSQDGVIIRLKAGSTGFDDPAKPKPVVSFFEQFMNPKANNGQAFRSSMFDMTIEVGEGNPGAVAFHYFNNNQGTVRNVTLRSLDPQKRGKAGLGLVTNWPGPALIENLTIDGFDYGVWSTIGQYSMAFEGLHLRHQREAGIWNRGQMLSIHQLTSDNKVPAIRQVERGLIVLDNAQLNGGDGKAAAIEAAGGLLVRNAVISGYGESVKDAKQPRDRIQAYASRDAAGLDRHKPLQPKPTPDIAYAPLDDWISVTAAGATPAKSDRESPDSTAAIQQAMDSGKSTVYFPRGTYYINDTIRVPASVTRVIGFEGSIKSGNGFENQPDKPVFRIEGPASAPPVVFERFEAGYGNKATVFFDHASPRTLIVRQAIVGGAYRNSVPGGTVFLDDICQGDLKFVGQTVFARQLNPENSGTKVEVIGGSLWCLNLKTEKGGTTLLASQDARVEVLGGYIYYNRGTDGAIPIINNDASVFFIAGLNIHGGSKGQTLVEETSHGKTNRTDKWPFVYVSP